MKRFSVLCKVALALALSLAFTTSVRAAIIDPSFGTDGGFTYSGYDAEIYLVKVLEDGKVLVGGSFNQYNGSAVQGGLVRLNADLTLDSTFDLGGEGFDGGSVRGVHILDDGKMLVYGSFESFNGQDAEGILRLNADGTLDETFDPSTGGSNTGGIWDVIALEDGDYLAAFASNGGTYRGEDVRGILRLNSDGSIDNSFSIDPKFEYLYVTAERMVMQPDGKIVVAGSFFYKGADGEYDYTCDYEDEPECEEDSTLDDESYRLMRLNADGSTDESFATVDDRQYASYGVNDIALLSDGKMYIGGQFSSYGNASSSNVARLNSDGTIDNTFSLEGEFWGAPVYALLVQDDGKLLVAGGFDSYDDKQYLTLIRFNADGSLDDTMPTSIAGGLYNAEIRTLALLSDGRLFMGGGYVDEYQVGYATYDVGGVVLLSLDPGVVLAPRTLSVREGDEVEDWHTDHTITVGLNTKPSAPVTVNLSSLNDEIQFSTTTFTFDPSDWDDPELYGAAPTFYTTVTAINDSVIEGNEIDQIIASVSSSDDDYDDIDADNVVVAVADNDSALLLDQTFRPTGIDGVVRALVIQPDDKSIVGGDFMGGIRRLNGDGTEDSSFDVGNGFNAQVNDIKRLSSGDIIAVGEFTQFDGENVGRIVRLNSDGSLDEGFDVGDGFNDQALDISLAADGGLFVSGYFSEFDGQQVGPIVLLDADGSLDTSFQTGLGFDGDVSHIQVQPNGKILVAGDFESYDEVSVPRGLVRLNADGSLDTAFSTNLGDGFNSSTRFVAVQPDGKIIVSGNFTEFDGELAYTSVRLNSDGTKDTSFLIPTYSYDEQTETESRFGLNGPIDSIVFLVGGKMLVGGDFSIYTTESDEDIASAVFMLNADGSLDQSLQPIVKYNEVTSIALQSDGKIVVSDMTGGRSLRRFDETGIQDESFNVWGGYGSGFPNAVKIKALSNGKYLAVGGFNGSYTQTLLMVNNDGTVDESWVPEPIVNDGVGGFFVDSDEKIMVWGDFGLARLNADGSLDETFQMDEVIDGLGIWEVVSYPGDKIMVGTDTNQTLSLVRLNADGSLDETFTLDSEIFDVDSGDSEILVDGDGKIIVSAEVIANNDYEELVRLNADGSIDEIISDNFGFHRFGLNKMIMQPDGKLLISGFFRRTSNSTPYSLTRLNSDMTLDRGFGLRSLDGQINDMRVLEDGSILIAGSFGHIAKEGESLVYGRRIMKLLPNGAVDPSFPTGGDGGGFEDTVYSFDIDSENKIIVAGQMETFRGVRVQNIVRLIDTALLENQEDVDTQNPAISNVSVTANSETEVRFSIATNEVTSARIFYGPTTSYGQQTDEMNVSNRVVSHVANINNLSACTVYHYQIAVKDASNNMTLSSDGTFKTLGCPTSPVPTSSVRRSSVSVSVPAGSSASLDTRGYSMQQIISLLARFMNPSVVEVLNNASVVATSTASRASTGSSSPAPRPSSIRRNLTVGSIGDDVRQLQSFLINQNGGSTTRAQALANVGATGYFGSLTRAALAEYQAANGVVPSAGYFGPVTRGVLQVQGQ